MCSYCIFSKCFSESCCIFLKSGFVLCLFVCLLVFFMYVSTKKGKTPPCFPYYYLIHLSLVEKDGNSCLGMIVLYFCLSAMELEVYLGGFALKKLS